MNGYRQLNVKGKISPLTLTLSSRQDIIIQKQKKLKIKIKCLMIQTNSVLNLYNKT